MRTSAIGRLRLYRRSVDCFTYCVNWYTEVSREGEQVTWCGYFAPIFSSLVFLGAGVFIIVEAADSLTSNPHDVNVELLVRALS